MNKLKKIEINKIYYMLYIINLLINNMNSITTILKDIRLSEDNNNNLSIKGNVF